MGDRSSHRPALKNFIIMLLKDIGILILIMLPFGGYMGLSYLGQLSAPTDKMPWIHWNGLQPSSQVYVSWETAQAEPSYIEYGTSPISLISTEINASQSNLHRFVLNGLIPDTKYYYRVGSDSSDIISAIQSFKTAPITKTAFNFTIISDSQQALGSGFYNTIADSIGNAQYGGTSFLINAGDLGQEYDSKSNWNHFIHQTNRFSDKIPLVPCLGNHDISRENPGGCKNFYTYYFNMSQEGCLGYYSFNWSNAFFAICQIAEIKDIYPNTGFAIAHDQWLNASLAAAQDKEYRFVIFHRQMWSSMGNGQELIDRIVPIVKKYNVSMVFYGHMHSYERFLVDDYTYVCLGGGGGMQNPYIAQTEYSQKLALGPLFTQILIDGNSLKFQTLTPNYDVVDLVYFSNINSKLQIDEVV